MKILKCLLMIVTAPVILVLTLFVWLCMGLIYISGLVLGLLSTVSILKCPKKKNKIQSSGCKHLQVPQKEKQDTIAY